MTREEATIQALRGHIEALSNEPCEDCISREVVKDYCIKYGLSETFDFINNLPSVKPKAEWIPCSERLPKELETVLVCVKTREKNLVAISYRSDYNYWNGLGRVDVVAWMPLPEAYKESKE